jgi:hypothetical protein
MGGVVYNVTINPETGRMTMVRWGVGGDEAVVCPGYIAIHDMNISHCSHPVHTHATHLKKTWKVTVAVEWFSSLIATSSLASTAW